MKTAYVNKSFSYLQLSIFSAAILLFQYKLFAFAFMLSFGLIIFLLFTSKQERVFPWIIAGYLTGSLLFLYGDKLLDALPFQHYILMIFNRVLLLIPILLLVYISIKFNKTAIPLLRKPDWNSQIFFPFIWSGFHSLKIKHFLVIAIMINFASFAYSIFSAENSFTRDFFTFMIGFSIINGMMEELLWRGIILSRMSELSGEKAAVLFSGLAFGFSHMMLGYSFVLCLLFAVGGIFYAAITVRSRSIFPAVIWHMAMNVFMILSGLIPFPG
ncbi:CPBP family intramembrane metalloprotease [Bacillus sp. CMF12]|uniref:CPBP family intramembrane glutamic endopeptidase n=1 Tax=Bacillaceae TaxID=186817 RepID=UPI001FB27604|nr:MULTISPECIES: CPBP family intramembrane glutamic endopeptidase [Bacillaceae]UOE57574.1 CPBP family intramembrane metalloprotease [Cytobacillus oceanisediminis]USK52035.1 CPBP family intramembrane metalloprotease [Bacillus sp. CMF12]